MSFNCPTLRDAINTAVSGDTIQFDPGIDGGTIALSQYSNDTSLGSTEFGPSAFFISHGTTLFIDGETGLTHGIAIARDTSKAPFRLFDVENGSRLTLLGLTFKDGLAQGFGSDRSHHGELIEMLGTAIDVSPQIQQVAMATSRGNGTDHCRTIDAGQGLQDIAGKRH